MAVAYQQILGQGRMGGRLAVTILVSLFSMLIVIIGLELLMSLQVTYWTSTAPAVGRFPAPPLGFYTLSSIEIERVSGNSKRTPVNARSFRRDPSQASAAVLSYDETSPATTLQSIADTANKADVEPSSATTMLTSPIVQQQSSSTDTPSPNSLVQASQSGVEASNDNQKQRHSRERRTKRRTPAQEAAAAPKNSPPSSFAANWIIPKSTIPTPPP